MVNIRLKIIARKINKIPEFYTIFARKMLYYIIRERDRGKAEAKCLRPRPRPKFWASECPHVTKSLHLWTPLWTKHCDLHMSVVTVASQALEKSRQTPLFQSDMVHEIPITEFLWLMRHGGRQNGARIKRTLHI